jgi:F-type H+-transporting ATPase subunit b
MTLLTLLAAAVVDPDAVGPIESVARQFGVDWWKLISQIISFTIVCAALHFFAYRPVLTVLEERRRKIEEGLANAAKIKVQLADAQKQIEEMMGQANVTATRLIEEARVAAKSLQERESQRAIAEAEQIIAKAHSATQAEHQKMLADLKRQVGRLVIDTTAKVTGKVLTSDDQKRLSEEASRELAA